MAVIIRNLKTEDETRWRKLWDGYCRFYDASVSADITNATWARLLDKDSAIFGLVAEVAGEVVGFTNCVLHDNTWSTKPVCYLEDLFCAPEARGQGVGRALVEAVQQMGRDEGWRHVYWRTDAGNVTAQSLYNKLAKRTDWVTYEMKL
ncbi:MAG: GNAT family N-acetyltransferase [Magnetovibrio sp.]|nr:GNAT family N-acetyltransferase [Magnetovibrio sp.]